MASDTATIRATLLTQYPAFSAVQTATIEAKIDEAREWVYIDSDQALIYFAIYLMLSAPTTLQISQGGSLKMLKSDNCQIEFGDASFMGSAKQFEALYTRFARSKIGPTLRVLGVDPTTGLSAC